MSDSITGLRRKMATAADLHTVVRAMKALAACSIGQYERSLLALADYDASVRVALGACLRQARHRTMWRGPTSTRIAAGSVQRRPKVTAIVFGSDQGLVGPFNDVVAESAISALAASGGTSEVWAVGERVQSRLGDARLSMAGCYAVPSSVEAIAPLVGQIQIDIEAQHGGLSDEAEVFLFHNRPQTGSLYEPVVQRLLPLDNTWVQGLEAAPWPHPALPQVIGSDSERGGDDGVATLRALVREHLFISLFRACAESLASENASRLAAMGRADRNIEESREGLKRRFHRLRQSSIDEELFDVTSGYEALTADAAASSGGL